MLKAFQLCGMVGVVFVFASMASAQPAAVSDSVKADIAVNPLDDYCGNMGNIKSISPDQIVIDGMNWDFESDSETVEEIYVVDSSLKVELDGYAAYGDIKVGDFIGIECEKKDNKMVVRMIQSESAINKSFEGVADMADENVVEDAAKDVVQDVVPSADAQAQDVIPTPAVAEPVK